MAQIAIYLDDQLAKRLDEVVKASGRSKSKWVAQAIKRSLTDKWPDGFFELAGSWKDEDGPGEIMARIRKGSETADPREKLF